MKRRIDAKTIEAIKKDYRDEVIAKIILASPVWLGPIIMGIIAYIMYA